MAFPATVDGLRRRKLGKPFNGCFPGVVHIKEMLLQIPMASGTTHPSLEMVEINPFVMNRDKRRMAAKTVDRLLRRPRVSQGKDPVLFQQFFHAERDSQFAARIPADHVLDHGGPLVGVRNRHQMGRGVSPRTDNLFNRQWLGVSARPDHQHTVRFDVGVLDAGFFAKEVSAQKSCDDIRIRPLA